MSRRRDDNSTTSIDSKESANVTPLRTIANRKLLRTIRALGLAAVLLGLAAAPAAASPVLQAGLSDNASEVQEVVVHATAGQYRLCMEDGGGTPACTGDLAFNANATTVRNALNLLSPISSAGTVSVVAPFFGGELHEIGITFDGGSLAHTDVPQLTAVDGTESLQGRFPPRLAVRTLHDAAVSRSDERIDYTATVKNTGPDPTSGTVTLEVQLPPGELTFALEAGGSGWTCSKLAASSTTPARASCTRGDALAPGASYPAVVVAAALGADAPATATATATANCACAFGPSTATDQFTFAPPIPFAISDAEGGLFEATGPPPFGSPSTQAGGHPASAAADYVFSAKRRLNLGVLKNATSQFQAVEALKQLVIDLPRGQVGNANATPEFCEPSTIALSSVLCPAGSKVGALEIILASNGRASGIPLVALPPEIGTPAQFAFQAGGNVYVISTRLRPEDHYAISLELEPAPKTFPLISEAILCNYGARVEFTAFVGCKKPGEPDANPQPLFTSPTRCDAQNPPAVRTRGNSWENPLAFVERSFETPPFVGCPAVPFEPTSDLVPSNTRADSPTGLTVQIAMPTEGLLKGEGCHQEQGNPLSPPAAECLGQANLDTATVTFPEGMSINPAAADGLGACTEAEVGLGNNKPATCPESSKVGTIEIDTPLINDTLTGNVYVAQQNHNPLKAPVGLYMVFSSPRDGITVKVAGKLIPDPVTGQLVSTFAENPEWPFSRLALHFNDGPRAPLINPPKCGTYAIHSEFSPWSAVDPANPTPEEIVSQDSVFHVNEGPGGGPCPSGSLEAKLKAGLQSNQAGAQSPFNLTLSRDDGSQRFIGLDVATPKGLTAYLKGIPYCPDAVLAGISTAEEAGRSELANPACPTASQIGTVMAGAGSGAFPFHTPGKVYLAGPYRGAPVSLAVVAPAVAGPFDLGNVVIRSALYINPETAQVTAKSDPIPTILHGMLIDLREIRLSLDRPNFTAAPTSCEPMSVDARVSGEEGGSANLSNRFQVGNCGSLGFRPRTRLQLFGGVKRGKYQGVRAVVRPRPGDANISRAVVRFPKSAFIAQEHIRTVCTRVQWATDACPKGSIYGRAIAYSPLLDEPLRGNVYLRSSDNELPDAVADLRGPANQPIRIEVAIRNDSVKGALRNTVLAAPDAPVSYFRVQLFGGKKGLIVNSRNVCRGKNNATVVMKGHNGKRSVQKTRVFNRHCKKLRRSSHKRHARHHRRRHR